MLDTLGRSQASIPGWSPGQEAVGTCSTRPWRRWFLLSTLTWGWAATSVLPLCCWYLAERQVPLLQDFLCVIEPTLKEKWGRMGQSPLASLLVCNKQ